jgi:aspartate beta-hydroxylase
MPAEHEVGALLARGAEFAAGGDARAAVSFYQAALEKAGKARPLDNRIVSQLRDAQAFIHARMQDFQHALDRALDGAQADDAGSLRLRHALDMVKGEREIFPQQPSMFYYPYLAQRQFFERDEFEWVAGLEAATADIRRELEALIAEEAHFRPYVEDSPNRPSRDFHGLNNNQAWTALYLWKHGAFVPEVAERCPTTLRALEQVPLSHIGERTPSVFFSRLEPGAHIPPHSGMLNSRLICHLPLIVPSGCWLRVGNETREWKYGELLIFDDSMEHEAKNPTDQVRIVLIFDIWRPELSAAERDGISAIFHAIDQFRAAPEA